jgi:hypothetical protein
MGHNHFILCHTTNKFYLYSATCECIQPAGRAMYHLSAPSWWLSLPLQSRNLAVLLQEAFEEAGSPECGALGHWNTASVFFKTSIKTKKENEIQEVVVSTYSHRRHHYSELVSRLLFKTLTNPLQKSLYHINHYHTNKRQLPPPQHFLYSRTLKLSRFFQNHKWKFEKNHMTRQFQY